MNPLEVLAERESIYRLLNQTTPENLSRDIANYTLDPHTRYPNLNTRSVLPIQVKNLYSCDDAAALEQCLKAPSTLPTDYSKKRRRKGKWQVCFIDLIENVSYWLTCAQKWITNGGAKDQKIYLPKL